MKVSSWLLWTASLLIVVLFEIILVDKGWKSFQVREPLVLGSRCITWITDVDVSENLERPVVLLRKNLPSDFKMALKRVPILVLENYSLPEAKNGKEWIYRHPEIWKKVVKAWWFPSENVSTFELEYAAREGVGACVLAFDKKGNKKCETFGVYRSNFGNRWYILKVMALVLLALLILEYLDTPVLVLMSFFFLVGKTNPAVVVAYTVLVTLLARVYYKEVQGVMDVLWAVLDLTAVALLAYVAVWSPVYALGLEKNYALSFLPFFTFIYLSYVAGKKLLEKEQRGFWIFSMILVILLSTRLFGGSYLFSEIKLWMAQQFGEWLNFQEVALVLFLILAMFVGKGADWAKVLGMTSFIFVLLPVLEVGYPFANKLLHVLLFLTYVFVLTLLLNLLEMAFSKEEE